MPRKSDHLLGEHVQGWLLGQSTLGSWSYCKSACGSITSANEPHAEFPRPSGWGMCLQKLGHLQSQAVCWGNAMTNFEFMFCSLYGGGFWQELNRSVECSLVITNSSLLMIEPLSWKFEEVSSIEATTHLSGNNHQPPVSWQVALACSERWQNELDQDIILPWWDLQPGVWGDRGS